jgi:aminoglycoside/choline kinase family phosphotransferase
MSKIEEFEQEPFLDVNNIPVPLMLLYHQRYGESSTISLLTPAGSNRNYYRFTTDQGFMQYIHWSMARFEPVAMDPNVPATVICVDGKDSDEAKAFIDLSLHFCEKELPVAIPYGYIRHTPYYMLEDLGEVSLFDAIQQGRATGKFSPKEKALLKRVIRLLPQFQVKGDEGLDYSTLPQPEFNRRLVMWDLNYFKYCFLKTTGIHFDEDYLEDDFEHMAEVLNGPTVKGFMYRDFQSRNVMIRTKDYLENLSDFYLDDDDEQKKERKKQNALNSLKGDPYFIDFQGGRRGPLLYDVASFVWQAKAHFPDRLRKDLVEEYLDALQELTPIDKDQLREQLVHFVLFRMLQVLGAYGFRGKFEHKKHFLESIPFALQNLQDWLKKHKKVLKPEYPYLYECLKSMCQWELHKEEEEEIEKETKVIEITESKKNKDN